MSSKLEKIQLCMSQMFLSLFIEEFTNRTMVLKNGKLSLIFPQMSLDRMVCLRILHFEYSEKFPTQMRILFLLLSLSRSILE